jgi:hypothetical protein
VIDVSNNRNKYNLFFALIVPYFSILFFHLDLVVVVPTSKVVVVLASPPSRRRFAGGGAPRQSPTTPLTVVGPDKTGQSNFCCFKQELPTLVRFVCQQALEHRLE